MKEKVCICGVFFLNRIRKVLFCKQNMAIYGIVFFLLKHPYFVLPISFVDM